MQVSVFVRKIIKTNRIYQLKIKCHTEPAYRQAGLLTVRQNCQSASLKTSWLHDCM